MAVVERWPLWGDLNKSQSMDCVLCAKQVAVVERWATCGEVAVSGGSSESQLLIGLRHFAQSKASCSNML